MKRLLFILSMLFLGSGIYGQCPPSNTVLTTQTQVDNFPAACINFTGDLFIADDNNTVDNITDLSPLIGLTSVSGALFVSNNNALPGLSGLDGLTSVGTLVIDDSDALTSLSGLDNLTSVDYLEIRFNDALISLDGLEGITSISNSVQITANTALTSLSGLENLASIGGTLDIFGNINLNTCNQLYHLLDNVNDVNPDYGPPVPDVAGGIDIQANLTNGNCNSVADILAQGPPVPPQAIPTMSEWGLILFGLIVFIIALVGGYYLKLG